jgi:TolB-like protein/tetratricopeptide (TPR) repeat protein
MYTDMVGYTALGQRNEALSLALVEEQRKVIRPILGRHRGREVKTIGDAFLVEFPNAVDAVRCAYDIQRAIREFNLSLDADKRIHLRIGVHVGEIVESQGDISGDAVNVASRIEPLAGDGGVCVTSHVYSFVRGKVDLPLTSVGPKSLKNVSEPMEVYRMVMPWEKETPVPPAQLDTRRIAILPFANFSPDPADAYFADGITDEIISTASSVGGLSVISRTSVMGYKETTKKVKEIGRELEVGSVLEGSFKKAGNKIRVTTQLIDVNNDSHVWSQSYDRDFDDVFAIQSDIAMQVASALRVKIKPFEEARIKEIPTRSTEAYTLYLRGRQLWNQRVKDAVVESLECFKHAVDVDPGFALAYAGMADSYSVMENWGYASRDKIAPKIREYVLRALKLDDRIAEAHTTYGNLLAAYEWKWDEAELEFKRAIELNPSYATAHQWYAYTVLRALRRVDEEMREAERALELDPLAPVMNLNKAQTLYFQERYEEAIECCRKALEIQPSFVYAYVAQASNYLMLKKFSESIELAETYLPRVGYPENRQKMALATVYGVAGRLTDAQRLLDEVVASSDKTVLPTEFAVVYESLGDVEKMFEHLDLAFTQRDTSLPWTLIDPCMKPFREDSRLRELKLKVGI